MYVLLYACPPLHGVCVKHSGTEDEMNMLKLGCWNGNNPLELLYFEFLDIWSAVAQVVQTKWEIST